MSLPIHDPTKSHWNVTRKAIRDGKLIHVDPLGTNSKPFPVTNNNQKFACDHVTESEKQETLNVVEYMKRRIEKEEDSSVLANLHYSCALSAINRGDANDAR